MINVVFDLSNMFFRSMFIVGGYGSKNYTFDNQYEIDQLMRKVSTDISYIVRQINPSRVILALDSRSWRKDIEIEENEGYKGNREKSGHINWDNVYATMKEFGEILDSNGFIVTKIENAEADDIMALWNNELLRKEGQHVVMVSSDEDIRQLVAFYQCKPGKTSFSVAYNPFASGKTSKKLYVPDMFEEWINTEDVGDIFNRAIDIDKQDFMRLRDSEKLEIERVDGNYIALRKVLCGDNGDNVPSIYSWNTVDKKGNDKTVRITESKAKKIIEALGIKDIWDLEERHKDLKKAFEEMSGQEIGFNVLERIRRQVKLVVLSEILFPKDIVDSFNEEVGEQLKKPNVQPQSLNVNSILEGTRYAKTKRGNESSIFRDIDMFTR